MEQLTLPEAVGANGRVRVVGRYGKTGLEKIVAFLAKNLLGRISIELASTLIPEANVIVEVAQEHRIMEEIENFGLVA